MMPEHDTRRAIIREWMALPKEKRQTEEQATAFAAKAKDRLKTLDDPQERILRWLLPRTAKE